MSKLNKTFKIDFDILNQSIDLDFLLIDTKQKNYWFSNTSPKIPIDTEIEDLTDDQKIALIRLAIYENYLDIEMISDLPNESFNIIK
jgi:hypothetical protein